MTSTPGDLASAIEVIDRFASEPERYSSEWIELLRDDDSSLCVRIKAALKNDAPGVDRDLRALLNQTQSAKFLDALAHVATTARVAGAEERQRRNAEAMVRTALVARDAQRAAAENAPLSADALEHLRLACQLLHFAKSLPGGRHAEPPSAADATEPVRRAFIDLETDASARVSLSGMAAARYWINAWWLDKDEGYNRDRLELPTVTLHSTGSRHFPGSFIAYARPTSRVAVLIEHPAIALLCLGKRLIDSIHDAWTSPEQKKTAVWKIDAHRVLAQDDESLGGAAAVIFHALSENATLAKNVLILGRLNQDHNILGRVGGVADKIREAMMQPSLIGLSVVLGSAVPPSDAPSKEHCGLTADELQTFGNTVPVDIVGNVRQALERTILRSSADSDAEIGEYRPGRDLGSSPPHYQLCEASLKNESHLIVKAWHIDDARRLLLRGSWDLEMRTLYRLCSLPRAEELLLTIKDSFVTKDKFVLVMRTSLDTPAGAPRTLPEALKARSEHPWLQNANVDTPKGRYAIWQGLRRIAEGIRLIHSQNVVHRNMSAECIYFSGPLEANSLRVGGFEWSARVGASPGQAAPNVWATAPDAGSALISIDTDWYGFGMLAARCFHDIEELAKQPVAELNRRVAEIYTENRRAQSPLTPYERALILNMIHPDRAERLKDPTRIMSEIDRILSHLGPQAYDMSAADDNSALYVICSTGNWPPLLKRFGFHPDPARPQVPYNEKEERHVAALKLWLKQRFKSPLLIRQPSGDLWLQGDWFALRLRSEDKGRGPAWTLARADMLDSISIPEQATFHDLREVPIVFLVKGRDQPSAYQGHRSWTHYFPATEPLVEDRNKAREALVRFLRCTNQLDLLLCYAEIFPCDVAPIGSEGYLDRVKVMPRIMADRGLPSWLRKAMNNADLFRHLQPRLDASSPEQRHVLLTRDDGIRIFARDVRDDEWDLHDVEITAGRTTALILARQSDARGRVMLPRGPMFIRLGDHHGQVELIDRRGKAIDQVTDFRYLLNALASPRPVWMSTRLEKLPLNDEQTSAIDGNKQSVLLDVLSARPIYALQGPPGTGKTTLIAHLARQILHEDQTAQILITAQAHGAVERLQETLQKIHTLEGDNPVVVIRLGVDNDGDGYPLAGARPATLGLREQTIAILRNAKEKLGKRFAERRPERSSVEADWIETLDLMLEAAVLGGEGKGAGDFNAFQMLIRDGANIVLCTTSNRDLEQIAEGDKTFDWSIVEEAGKVHGFDLALPMKVGHRWLLVGDQKQLEAYRLESFKDALQLDEMDDSTELLKRLHARNPDLIDKEWPGEWEQMRRRGGEAGVFLRTASVWLQTFDRIYKTLKPLAEGEEPTQSKDIGSSIGLLINQYRMHPAIGKLVTETYYPKDRTVSLVKNCTGTIDDPIPRVIHGLDTPAAVKGLAIVWLDVPWCGTEGSPQNVHEQRVTSYWNQAEIDLIVAFCKQLGFRQPPEPALNVAVLSPYTAQKNRLQKQLRETFPQGFGPGLKVKEGLYGRQASSERRFTHTVDSFQGNEADIVIASFTRNNKERKIGFMIDSKRMNVLLSRAQRLLVLVGSWDFFQNQILGIDREVDPRHELAHVKRMFSNLEDLEGLPVPAFARLRFDKGTFRRVQP